MTIPEEIRLRLGLEPGAQFVVVGDRDVVIFKVIAPPDRRQFETLVANTRKAARRAGVKRRDVAKAVARVRRTQSA